MKWIQTFLMIAALLSACTQTTKSEPDTAQKPGLATGKWRVVIASPGGDLPFHISVASADGELSGNVHNGDEVLPFDTVTVDDNGQVMFRIDHYESAFEGKLSQDGKTIEGFWSKTAGPGQISKLPFRAEYGAPERFRFQDPQPPADVNGRWAVTFENGDGDPKPAVAVFEQQDAILTGTFLTPVGDYRYLEGAVNGNTFYLSCFDGGHVFLFKGILNEDQTISGEFWSRDTWHDIWTAERKQEVDLDDPYSLTTLKDNTDTFRFSFPDLEGNTISHDDPQFEGKVRLITLFGTWCPNCNDEAPFLQKLYAQYKDQGLEVIGLAFEMTPDEQRSRRVLKRFKKRHGLDYTLLVAGGSTDKATSAAALPDLETLIAYPTTLMVDRDGKVVSIHTGFNGPGTGELYKQLEAQYHEKIKALL